MKRPVISHVFAAFLTLAIGVLTPVRAEDNLLRKAQEEVQLATNLARTADETWCRKPDPTECRRRVHEMTLALRRAGYALAALTPASPKPVIVAEGDSITAPAYSWASLHAAKHPEATFHNLAIGGSDIDMMTARIDAVLAKRPAEVWLLIGANNMPDAKAFLVKLWTYVDRVRATGAKVYVGTILPQKDRPLREAQRAIANAGIMADAAKHGATVIPFHLDPRYGDHEDASDPALFGDGVHPGMALQKVMEEGAVSGAHDPVAPGFILSPTLAGAAPWEASFDDTHGLAPAGIPGTYSETAGAFRFTCGGDGPIAADDPVLLPKQPGAAHLHLVWGNLDFSAFTTPDTLKASGRTNCNSSLFALNRSSYWMPALLNDQGEVIRPDLISVYYKRQSRSAPTCQPGNARFMGICVGLPNGIRYIFGWNPKAPNAKVEGASWYCTGSGPAHFGNLDDVFADGCKAGDTLIANTLAQNCWDGKNLDSPDHRAHVAFAQYLPTGRYACPVSHPYVIPQEENKAAWTVTADMIAADGTSRVRLSSDHMKTDARPGETLHGDYLEAWDASAKKAWEENCLDKRLSCNDGNLGNGWKLIGAEKPSYGWVNPAPRVSLAPSHAH